MKTILNNGRTLSDFLKNQETAHDTISSIRDDIQYIKDIILKLIPKSSRLYTLDEAAIHFGVHQHTIRNWIKNGVFKEGEIRRVSNKLMLSEEAILGAGKVVKFRGR